MRCNIVSDFVSEAQLFREFLDIGNERRNTLKKISAHWKRAYDIVFDCIDSLKYSVVNQRDSTEWLKKINEWIKAFATGRDRGWITTGSGEKFLKSVYEILGLSLPCVKSVRTKLDCWLNGICFQSICSKNVFKGLVMGIYRLYDSWMFCFFFFFFFTFLRLVITQTCFSLSTWNGTKLFCCCC